jgi:hypothetical protein
VGHDAESRKPAPDTAAPARQAKTETASQSVSTLLAIQRSAGNQAVVAMLGSSSPPNGTGVVRRAWVEGGHTDTWDAVIGGLEWERHEEPALEYRYWVADGVDDAVRTRFIDQQNEWHPAAWWRDTWAERAAWPDVLEPVAAAAPVVAGPVEAAEHEEPDDPPDAPAGPVVVDAAAATAQLGHPTVASVRAVQYAPGGRFSWPVTMTASVAAQPSRTWIIQQVDATLNGTVSPRYWEAFLVPAGQTVAPDQDIYLDPEEYGGAGTSTVRGIMQHHAFDGNGAPPGFVLGAGNADGEQLATTVQPAFWGAGGTAHDITVVWNDGAGAPTITTVPATGAATRVASHADFT